MLNVYLEAIHNTPSTKKRYYLFSYDNIHMNAIVGIMKRAIKKAGGTNLQEEARSVKANSGKNSVIIVFNGHPSIFQQIEVNIRNTINLGKKWDYLANMEVIKEMRTWFGICDYYTNELVYERNKTWYAEKKKDAE